MEYNKEWEYGTPVDCDCESNFIHVDCGCKSKEVCECEKILLEISKLKTQDTVLQREIDEISGASISGVTEEQMNEAIASAKTEIEAEIPTVPTNVSTFINDASYVTTSELLQYISNLQQQINSLIASISGCCSHSGETMYRWVTMTGDNDYVCSGTTKYTKEKQQSSEDGLTWVDTGNMRSGSTILEENCVDCGGSGDTRLQSSLQIGYGNLQTIFAYKDNTVVASNEIDKHISRNDILRFAASSEVTGIEDRALSGCTALTAVSFGNYSALEEQQDPSSLLTSIGDYAFSGCSSLKRLELTHLKASVPTLGTGVFDGCSSLVAIYVNSSLVNDFKTAPGWSTYANLIQGLG